MDTDRKGTENTGFLSTMGLAFVGGLKVEVEVAAPSVAYFLFGTGLVMVMNSSSSRIFVFFFKVHWFCLANVSAAVVISGLSTSCGGFSTLFVSSGELFRHKFEKTDTELASGKSMTRSGVWLCL